MDAHELTCQHAQQQQENKETKTGSKYCVGQPALITILLWVWLIYLVALL